MKTKVGAILFSFGLATAAQAQEISHYAPGLANIRDFVMPVKSGFYVADYNFYYQSGRLSGKHGNEVPLPGPDAKYPDIDVFMMSIPIVMVQKAAIGPVDYGFMLAPSLANNNIDTSLYVDGDDPEPYDEQFGFGDLYVQPIWLGYAPTKEEQLGYDRYALSLSWGFYAPTGEYDTDLNTAIGVRVADLDNIGFGFWTNQVRGAVQLSPFKSRGPAIVLATTYEVSSEKIHQNVTPGQQVSFNWGISQFLPEEPLFGLWRMEVGLAGYDSWQVTSDDGNESLDGTKDEVHAVGFQLGLIRFCDLTAVNFHYFNEFDAESRFEGHVIGLSISTHFGEKWFLDGEQPVPVLPECVDQAGC